MSIKATTRTELPPIDWYDPTPQPVVIELDPAEGWQPMKSNGLPTPEKLREFVRYEPDTGRLFWVAAPGRHKEFMVGQPVGCMHRGYHVFKIGRKYVPAHRAAFCLMTGRWPDQQIDHINGDKSDNRWANLREVDQRTNTENQRRAMCRSKVGALGVTKRGEKFGARVFSRGKEFWLGLFNTAEEAHRAYVEAKRLLHIGCTL